MTQKTGNGPGASLAISTQEQNTTYIGSVNTLYTTLLLHKEFPSLHLNILYCHRIIADKIRQKLQNQGQLSLRMTCDIYRLPSILQLTFLFFSDMRPPIS